MYYNGQGVARDYAAAVYWYRKAANQGQAYAQKSLQELLAEVPPAATAPLPQRSTAAAAPLPQQNTVAAAPLPQQSTVAAALVPQRSVSGSTTQMKREGGTYVVPVLINNAITLDFMVDSGASDVSIPADVVSTLIRAGTIKNTDFIDEQTYTLADGSKVKSHTFRIRSLKVGDRVLENVTGSVAPAKGSLLLGQSFLGRFKSWSIDNGKHVLVLE
jgi:clan AA aspartic protease (TIGR02281 family)